MGMDIKLHKRKRKRERSDSIDEINDGLDDEKYDMNRRFMCEKIYELEYQGFISKDILSQMLEDECLDKLLSIKHNTNQPKKVSKIFKRYINTQIRNEIDTIREISSTLQKKHIFNPLSIYDTRTYIEKFLK